MVKEEFKVTLELTGAVSADEISELTFAIMEAIEKRRREHGLMTEDCPQSVDLIRVVHIRN